MKKRLVLLVALLLLMVATAWAEEPNEAGEPTATPVIQPQTIETYTVVKPQFNITMGALGAVDGEGSIDVSISWDDQVAPSLYFDIIYNESDGGYYYKLSDEKSTNETVTFTVTNSSTAGMLDDKTEFDGSVIVSAVITESHSKYVIVILDEPTTGAIAGPIGEGDETPGTGTITLTYSDRGEAAINNKCDKAITTSDVTTEVTFTLTLPKSGT